MDLPDPTDSKYSVGSFPRLLLFARSKQLSGLSTDNHSSSISPRVRGSFYDFEVRSTAALSHESETSQTASVAAGAAAAAAAAAAAPAYSVGAGTVNLEAAQPRDDKPRTEGVTFLGRFLMMYCDALDKRPVFTKSISSGLIGLLGDLLAQTVGWGIGDGQIPWNGTRALWRSCAVMLDGFFINGPLLHYCYEFLEKHMPAGDSIRASVFQVAVDVFIIDPVFAFIFVWSTGLIEGRSVKNGILHVLEHSYPEMVLWLVVIGLVWAPLQVYLFNRYPVQFRVLTADIIDLVWTCVSSFFSHAR